MLGWGNEVDGKAKLLLGGDDRVPTHPGEEMVTTKTGKEMMPAKTGPLHAVARSKRQNRE